MVEVAKVLVEAWAQQQYLPWQVEPLWPLSEGLSSPLAALGAVRAVSVPQGRARAGHQWETPTLGLQQLQRRRQASPVACPPVCERSTGVWG